MKNKRKMLSSKIKEKNCQNIKRLPHSILYFEGQMHLYPCVYIYILYYNFDGTIFNIIYAHLLQNIRLF